MQLKLTLFSALAALAAAQDVSKIPDCSLNCFVDNFPLSGCKDLVDFKCSCAAPKAYQDAMANCIVGHCDNDGIVATVNWVSATCASVGVPWP
ncbi:uncharacterized protein E0L32_003406 [Thyridium curvatum]|uniref:CFEM domain-containing protein n=1 Tax=Thyridium curvatum TaxID=1093900 RepID=A0A507BDQ4_9PEZI|nr:uncharacterized protein E0L32_003406 [Thyridium curvatum]TPX16844.1 hypothetical protein E0L32_003406 [Thyridium curvatum]